MPGIAAEYRFLIFCYTISVGVINFWYILRFMRQTYLAVAVEVSAGTVKTGLMMPEHVDL